MPKLDKRLQDEILKDADLPKKFVGSSISTQERIRLHQEGKKNRKSAGNKKEALLLPKNIMEMRRKPCICGSGKRFKNCCLKKVV